MGVARDGATTRLGADAGAPDRTRWHALDSGRWHGLDSGRGASR